MLLSLSHGTCRTDIPSDAASSTAQPTTAIIYKACCTGEASKADAVRRTESLKRSLDEEVARGARETAKRQRLEEDNRVRLQGLPWRSSAFGLPDVSMHPCLVEALASSAP